MIRRRLQFHSGSGRILVGANLSVKGCMASG
jgi:hypothetical protein